MCEAPAKSSDAAWFLWRTPPLSAWRSRLPGGLADTPATEHKPAPATEHTPAPPTEQAPSRHAYRSLLFAVFLYGLYVNLVNSMHSPFLRTLISCDAPVTAPHFADEWSGSAYCGDKNEVITQAQRLGSSLAPLATALHMVTGPFLAAAADRYSRIVVIAIGLLIEGISLACLALAATAANHEYAATHALAAPLWLLIARAVFNGVSSTGAPVNALAADLAPKHEHARVYLAIAVAHGGAGLLGAVGGIAILKLELDDYSLAWRVALLALPLAASPLLLVREPSLRSRSPPPPPSTPPPPSITPPPPSSSPKPVFAPRRVPSRSFRFLLEQMLLGAAGAEDAKAEARAAADTNADRAEKAGKGEKGETAGKSEAEGDDDARMSLQPAELARGLLRLARSSRFLRLLCVGDGLVVGGLVGLFSVLNSFVMAYYGWRQV